MGDFQGFELWRQSVAREVTLCVVNKDRVALLKPESDPACLLFMSDPSLGAAIGYEAQSPYVKHFRPQVMTRRLEEEFEGIVLAAHKRAP